MSQHFLDPEFISYLQEETGLDFSMELIQKVLESGPSAYEPKEGLEEVEAIVEDIPVVGGWILGTEEWIRSMFPTAEEQFEQTLRWLEEQYQSFIASREEETLPTGGFDPELLVSIIHLEEPIPLVEVMEDEQEEEEYVPSSESNILRDTGSGRPGSKSRQKNNRSRTSLSYIERLEEAYKATSQTMNTLVELLSHLERSL